MKTSQGQGNEEFNEFLSAAMAELRLRRGVCPTAEDLVSLYYSKQPLDEAARIHKHIDDCGECASLLITLEATNSAERAIRASPMEWLRGFTVIRRVALAAAMGALCVASYFVGRLVAGGQNDAFKERPHYPIALSVARNFRLEATLGGPDAFGNANILTIDRGEQLFVLSFFVPRQPSPESKYDFRIRRPDGTETPPQALPGCGPAGICDLVCPKAEFPAGSYQLAAREHAAGRTKVYTYDFRIAP